MKKLFLLVSVILCTVCELKNLVLRSRRTAVYRETKERKYAEIFPLFPSRRQGVQQIHHRRLRRLGAGLEQRSGSAPGTARFLRLAGCGSDRAAGRKCDRRPLRRCIQPKSGVASAGTAQR